MIHNLKDGSAGAVGIEAIALEEWDLWTRKSESAGWLAETGFAAEPGAFALIPDSKGALGSVVVVVEPGQEIWAYAQLAIKLPARVFRLAGGETREVASAAALGWALGGYRFDKYKSEKANAGAVLAWPDGVDRKATISAAEATFLVRDLVNTPAQDMGPEELIQAAVDMAGRTGGRIEMFVGGDLLTHNFPAVHAVGRASSRRPRLVGLVWGDESLPKLTLIGKGVCFDSGGLRLKPPDGMLQMKDDMAGAAQCLGLAQMILDAGLKVRLRVIITAVENMVSGGAYKPRDVIPTRSGQTVEIISTDAEGRMIMADCLTWAGEESPDLIIDCATLTGAARVALGREMPAIFSNRSELADRLRDIGFACQDPAWPLPLYRPYAKALESDIADTTNSSQGGPWGAATVAALFLERFVAPDQNWIHLDHPAIRDKAALGRPKGGDAYGMRALYQLICERYGS